MVDEKDLEIITAIESIIIESWFQKEEIGISSRVLAERIYDVVKTGNTEGIKKPWAHFVIKDHE